MIDHLIAKFWEMFHPGSRVTVDKSYALEKSTGLEAIHQDKTGQIWHQNV
jgi:hypothetical protein